MTTTARNLHLVRIPRLIGRTKGVTLIELMISMVLGLLVVIAATALLISSKAGYITQDNASRMDDAGRYAIESIARAIRQSAYVNWDSSVAPIVATAVTTANIIGLDAARLSATAPGISSPNNAAINGSDVLAIRFFGSGFGSQGDGTMTNCAGFGVPAANFLATAEAERGWSIFYVSEDASGEPQLYCKYRGETSWSADAIVRGVESFQVLYGIDTDDDGLPNRMTNAAGVEALDAGAPSGTKPESFWKKVVTVKVSLLVRAPTNEVAGKADDVFDLFGKDYSSAQADMDEGVQIESGKLPKAVRHRPRRIYTSTVQLRNHAAASGA